MSTPYWVQDAIFYHIFPDRFAAGNPSSASAKWGTPPTNFDHQGGDLRGIIRHFDYLLDLGVTAIYLNPIFTAPSNHRYNTTDFFQIDPRLGDMVDFNALLDVAHRNNVRIILDGVFNHVGRGFFAFVDVMENGYHSVYRDWFHIHRMPLDAYSPGEASNYSAWWNIKSLPKLNTSNPAVRSYLLSVARYWIERGTDGWRLDVPNEINDDDFWAEFRHVVKSANRDAYLLGEIWTTDPRWANDTHFDGLMNYPLREAILAALNGQNNARAFADRAEGLLKMYARENIFAMYNTLGTHDTERIFTLLGNRVDKARLAFQFLMAYPGTPALYYGDEIGLEGGKDPDNRRAFPWDPEQWKGDLRDWVHELVGIRRLRASLRRGEYIPITVEESQVCYAFARTLGEESTLILLNLSDQKLNIQVPIRNLWRDGRSLRNLIDHQTFEVSDGKISVTLDAWTGFWIG